MQRNANFREIYKSNWLRKQADRQTKSEIFWMVFCIHNENEPYLEAYANDKSSLAHNPLWSLNLSNIVHISSCIGLDENEHEFVITSSTEVVRLFAQSRQLMREWLEILQNKLIEMKILAPKENLYSRGPRLKINLTNGRDPSSPLPTPPTDPGTSATPGLEPIQQSLSRLNSVDSEQSEYEHVGGLQLDVDGAMVDLRQPRDPTALYEPVFARASSGSEENRHSLTAAPLAPQPITLKEQQVKQLQKEIAHPVGIRMQLRGKDCANTIALVAAFGAVWVAGWKQKNHPILYNLLHIGDQLISIDDQPVISAVEAAKTLKCLQNRTQVQIVVRRVPFGRALLIRRDHEGQSLGIVQQANTAVIAQVLEGSPAARDGLTPRAHTCDGLSLTQWVLTEINGRPLNLFFKGTEVRDRLNSVGKEITVLIQPLDLIKQLKKQLKSLKNYKEYILQ